MEGESGTAEARRLPEHRTLRSHVVGELRGELVEGRLPPGAHLNEGRLAADYGISRGTLREAMRVLEQEGLLTTQPHRGTVVRVVSAREIRQIYDVRSVLETRAAELVAARLSDDICGTLEAALARLGSVQRRRGSLRDTVRADIAFHEAICQAASNPTLMQLWRSLVGQIMATMITVGRESLTSLQGDAAHRPLLDAIYSRDGGEIRRAFECHFRHSSDVLAAAVERRDASAVEDSY